MTTDDPDRLAASAADTIDRLLAVVEADEVTAPPRVIARLEGAQRALRALADEGSEDVEDAPETERQELRPRTLWTRAMLNRLSDGEWHRRIDVLIHVQRHIPPRRAVHAGRTARGKPDDPEAAEDDAFALPVERRGARAMASDAIDGWVRRGRVQRREDEDGVVWLRLDPQYVYRPDED